MQQCNPADNIKYPATSPFGMQELPDASGETNMLCSCGSRLCKCRCRAEQINSGCYASIWLADGSTSQTIPTGAGFTKLTGFTTNGEYANCIADADNDQIVIQVPGRYMVTASFSTKASKAGIILNSALFKGGNLVEKVRIQRRVATANESSNGAMTGILNCAGGCAIDVRVTHNDAGNIDLTMVHGNLNVHRIGD